MAECRLRQAAIVLGCLPREHAVRLLSALSPRQVEAVARELARLSTVSLEDQLAVLREFADSEAAVAGAATCGAIRASELVESAVGSHAARAVATAEHGAADTAFGDLQGVEAALIIELLTGEHPQTAALVLSHLAPQQAADVLAGLAEDDRRSVVRRLATIRAVDPAVLTSVARRLAQRVKLCASPAGTPGGGVECLAGILRVADSALEASLVAALADDGSEPAR